MSESSRFPGSAIGLFVAGNVLFAAGLFFHAFLYNFYLGHLGFSSVEMGYAAASLTTGGLLALVPAGKLVDRFGPRRLLLGAVVLSIVGLGYGALATTVGEILLTSAAAGFATATWRVAMAPEIMRLTTHANRSRVFAWNVALMVGTGGLWIAASGVAPDWISGLLGTSELPSIRIALLVSLVGTVMSGLVYWRLAEPSTPRQPSPPKAGVVAGRSSIEAGIGLLVLAVALWMLAPALVLPFFNIYFADVHGIAIGDIGFIFAAAHGVTALAIMGSGEVATRFGSRFTLTIWMLSFGPLMFLLAVAASPWMAVSLYLLQGFISPATNPLIDQELLERAPPGRQGAVSSWRNVATELSGVFGSAGGGWVIHIASFGTLFVVAGAVGVVGGVTLAFAIRRIRVPQVAARGD